MQRHDKHAHIDKHHPYPQPVAVALTSRQMTLPAKRRPPHRAPMPRASAVRVNAYLSLSVLWSRIRGCVMITRAAFYTLTLVVHARGYSGETPRVGRVKNSGKDRGSGGSLEGHARVSDRGVRSWRREADTGQAPIFNPTTFAARLRRCRLPRLLRRRCSAANLEWEEAGSLFGSIRDTLIRDVLLRCLVRRLTRERHERRELSSSRSYFRKVVSESSLKMLKLVVSFCLFQLYARLKKREFYEKFHSRLKSLN